jgi:hypothetical protein
MRYATVDPRTEQRRFRDPSARRSITWIDPEWHTRAVYEASAVRRILRSAHAGGSGVVGVAATMDALEAKTTRDLLITARFVELNSRLAALIRQAVDAGQLTTRTITGVAALELDLVGEGIGAILSRKPGRLSGGFFGGSGVTREHGTC